MKNLETPYFIIHYEALENNLVQLKEALQKNWNNTIVGYSFKTNSLPYILDYMKRQSCFAEVVSDAEYDIALQIGFKSDHIIFNGPVKSKDYFYKALTGRSVVNIDSKREIEWLKSFKKPAKVGIRVNFNINKYCKDETPFPDDGSRFGFNYENGELAEAIESINSIGVSIQLIGLHLHVSSKTRSLNIFKVISKMACKVKKEFSLNLEYIDVGGGFFGDMINKPDFNDYLEVITNELNQDFDKDKITIIVEPGASLIASPIDYVCQVIDIKYINENRIIVTDGSRVHIDPLFKKSNYSLEFDSSKKEKCCNQIICGFTCMEEDRITTIKNDLELNVGDGIIFKKAGSYTVSFNSLFIDFFPKVYLKKENEIYVVRDKWTVNEFMQKNYVGLNLIK